MAPNDVFAQLPDAFASRFPINGVARQPGAANEPTIPRGTSTTIHNPRSQEGPPALADVGALMPRLDVRRDEPEVIIPPDDLRIDPFRTVSDDQSETQRVKELVSSLSTERLAWYDSFRQPTWGITIRSAAIELIAHVLRSDTADDWHERTAVAFEILYHHEYAHFLFDVAASTLEDFEGRPLWLPFHLSPLNNPCSEREEALCNAFAYRRVRRGWKKRVGTFMRGQPAGYRDFHIFIQRDAFTAGVEEHLKAIVYGSHQSIGTKNWRPLFQDHDHGLISPVMVPLHIHHD